LALLLVVQLNGAAKPPSSDTHWSYRLRNVSISCVDPSAVYVDALTVIRDIQVWLLSVGQQMGFENTVSVGVLAAVAFREHSAH
jgi:hypothetical protein